MLLMLNIILIWPANLANPAEIPESCSVSDKVYLFSPVLHVDEKLAFKKYWKGPYEVVKKINSVIFRVKRMNDDSDIQDIYIKRLKKKQTPGQS